MRPAVCRSEDTVRFETEGQHNLTAAALCGGQNDLVARKRGSQFPIPNFNTGNWIIGLRVGEEGCVAGWCECLSRLDIEQAHTNN